jgi:hypothetical protein
MNYETSVHVIATISKVLEPTYKQAISLNLELSAVVRLPPFENRFFSSSNNKLLIKKFYNF